MRFAFVLALVCFGTPAVQASPENSQPPITLQQVVARVLEKNPQLAIHEYENQAAAAHLRLAQQSTPLAFKLELENIAGSGGYQRADQLESTLSLAKLLEPKSLRTSRSELAQQQTTLLHNEQASQRLDLLAQAAEQFIHVVVDQQRLGIAEEHLVLVKRTNKIVSQRVAAGRSHVAERRRVAMELTRAEIELEHAEHELSTSRLKLASHWGQSQTDFGSAQAKLFELPPLAPFEQLEALLSNNPDLVRLASKQRIAQTRLRLAQAHRTTRVELAGGIRYFNDSNDAALMASVSIPFGSRSRAQPQIDEMQALSQQEPLRFEQQRLALYVSLYELYQEASHARTAHEGLSQRIIPAAKQAAADYEKGYQSGRFSLLELNEAQGALLDAQLEAIMTAANYHRLKIEIERLTGAALHSGEQS